jgi:hypothetical protein
MSARLGCLIGVIPRDKMHNGKSTPPNHREKEQ